MGTLAAVDRRLGQAMRARIGAHPAVDRAARIAAAGLAPAFEGMVAALVAERPTRAAGLRAGSAAVCGALVAKGLRDAIGRPRPGERAEGGFPSRHAAAATAIVRSIGRSNRHVGRALGVVAAIGLVGRIATGEHDPADIVAGAAVGGATEWAVAALSGQLRTPEPG